MTEDTKADVYAMTHTDRDDPAALYRSAAHFERRGMPATARLFRNAAWCAERKAEREATTREDGSKC